MKVAWNNSEREFGGMKSVNENYHKNIIWKLPTNCRLVKFT